MTTLELLHEYLDRERNNVFCYSANYLMDTPKRGYEREFQEAQEKAEILVDLIDQIERGFEPVTERTVEQWEDAGPGPGRKSGCFAVRSAGLSTTPPNGGAGPTKATGRICGATSVGGPQNTPRRTPRGKRRPPGGGDRKKVKHMEKATFHEHLTRLREDFPEEEVW